MLINLGICMKRIYLIVIIISLVFVSGCTGSGGLFGGDVIKTKQTSQQDGVKDILVIKNKETIPHSPLLPDKPLILSFVIESMDDIRTVDNVNVELFDAPLFKNEGGKAKCNENGNCVPKELADKLKTILPGEQKTVNFYLTTPSEEEIAKIRTDATLSFRINYDFDSTTTLRVPVVNMGEIEKRQRAGESTTLEIPKYFTSGPVQIDIEVMNQPYIISGYDASIIFKVKDRGDKTKGFLKDSKIEKGKLTITFPEGFTATTDNDQYFVCVNGCQGEGTNNNVIDLYRGESIPLYFKVKPPDVAEPYKSFEIKANVKYTYELRDSAKLTINPYGNV